MNPKLTRTAVATLAAGAIATGGVVALDGPATARSHGTTMHFVAHDDQFAMDDLGQPSPQGPGIGDVVVLTQSLTRDGKTVGRIHNASVDVDARRHLFEANGTIVLHGGTLQFGGLVSQTPHFVLAITGGTGRYQRAAGRVTFDFPGNRQLVTVSLKR